MISSQKLWPVDHEAGLIRDVCDRQMGNTLLSSDVTKINFAVTYVHDMQCTGHSCDLSDRTVHTQDEYCDILLTLESCMSSWFRRTGIRAMWFLWPSSSSFLFGSTSGFKYIRFKLCLTLCLGLKTWSLFMVQEIFLVLLILVIMCCEWTGQLSRYSDWLRAGWSADLIPVWARFSVPVQTGPVAQPTSCTMGTGSFPGTESGRNVMLIPHPF
jgi:hypothetical protein